MSDDVGLNNTTDANPPPVPKEVIVITFIPAAIRGPVAIKLYDNQKLRVERFGDWTHVSAQIIVNKRCLGFIPYTDFEYQSIASYKTDLIASVEKMSNAEADKVIKVQSVADVLTKHLGQPA